MRIIPTVRHDDARRVFPLRTPQRAGTACPVPGFTLLELLVVIAIIGMLAALIFPAVNAARRSANRARTRVQFSQWAAAIESFRGEYGHYPAFDPSNLVNGGATVTDHVFHDVLAGKRRDGSALPAGGSATAQNRKRIPFHVFSEADFTPTGLIGDAFDNTEIAVLLDRNLDGRISMLDYPEGMPTVAGLRPGAADFPSAGIRAGVAFYAPDAGAGADNPAFICSWK